MRSVTVLLVEDDAEVARLMQKWGYDATHVLTSREAVDFAVLHQSEIALVVCDVNQGVSGPAVARGICPRTKTLVSSGSPFDVLCEDGLMTWETPQNGDT